MRVRSHSVYFSREQLFAKRRSRAVSRHRTQIRDRALERSLMYRTYGLTTTSQSRPWSLGYLHGISPRNCWWRLDCSLKVDGGVPCCEKPPEVGSGSFFLRGNARAKCVVFSEVGSFASASVLQHEYLPIAVIIRFKVTSSVPHEQGTPPDTDGGRKKIIRITEFASA